MPRFSLEDIENARPENPEKLAGTTEEEIQLQITEDGGFDMGEAIHSELTTQEAADGGFKRSSQHPDEGGCDEEAEAAFGSVRAGCSSIARPAARGAA